MTNWAHRERDLLCDELLARGPEAPTLCDPWTARDLAAHLVLRERRPDAAAGIVLHASVLTRYTAKVQDRLAARPWEELVEAVRSGPPCWSPTRIGAIDELANTVEFFVHHEDVRRAAADWQPRPLDPGHEQALTKALGRLKPMLRRCPVGLEFRTPDGTVVAARSGARTVTVTGAVGELLLYAFGRKAVARVELAGEEADVRAVQDTSFGV